jgi:hypothetical protein
MTIRAAVCWRIVSERCETFEKLTDAFARAVFFKGPNSGSIKTLAVLEESMLLTGTGLEKKLFNHFEKTTVEPGFHRAFDCIKLL